MMSDNKNLLKEGTIRRFMTLASIGGLTENFLDNNEPPDAEVNENEELEEEEKAEELEEEKTEELEENENSADVEVQEEGGMSAVYDRDVEEELPGEELPGEELPGEEGAEDLGELPAEEEEVEASVTVPEEDVESLRKAVDVLNQVLGAAEGAEEAEEELPGEELPGEALPGEEEPVMEKTEETNDLYEEDVINEVTRRVLERIRQQSGKEKVAEELAERIFQRLSKKG